MRERVAAEKMEDLVSVDGRGWVVPGEARLADALVLLGGEFKVALQLADLDEKRVAELLLLRVWVDWL